MWGWTVEGCQLHILAMRCLSRQMHIRDRQAFFIYSKLQTWNANVGIPWLQHQSVHSSKVFLSAFLHLLFLFTAQQLGAFFSEMVDLRHGIDLDGVENPKRERVRYQLHPQWIRLSRKL